MGDHNGYTSIQFERIGDVLKVTLANPRNELNAVDGEFHDELRRLFADLKVEREARAVLLTASGRAFSAGGDFNWMRGITKDDLYEMRREGRQIFWNLLDVELPIVAAVNGPAIGLGATIALLCDAIYMADSAVLADPHVRVGIAAGDGGAAIWPLVMGPALAKRYLMTGDSLSAVEAERYGLVTGVTTPEELGETALKFAQKLAGGAPLAVRYTKAAINQYVKQAATTTFDYSMGLELVTFVSDDHQEALAALNEKRKPIFRGR